MTRPAQSRPKVGAKKIHKPCVMFTLEPLGVHYFHPNKWNDNRVINCAVLPCATLKSARAWVTFAKMERYEKIDAIAAAIAKNYGGDHYSPVCIRAAIDVLAAMEGGAK